MHIKRWKETHRNSSNSRSRWILRSRYLLLHYSLWIQHFKVSLCEASSHLSADGNRPLQSGCCKRGTSAPVGLPAPTDPHGESTTAPRNGHGAFHWLAGPRGLQSTLILFSFVPVWRATFNRSRGQLKKAPTLCGRWAFLELSEGFLLSLWGRKKQKKRKKISFQSRHIILIAIRLRVTPLCSNLCIEKNKR